MKILVTSIVDIGRVPYNRIHVFLNHLSQKHQITALCLNAWWLEKRNAVDSDDKIRRDPYFRRVFDRVQINYLTERRLPPILQEMVSIGGLYRLLRKTCHVSFDLHVNYASLVSGLFVGKILRSRGIPTVFDVPDDLPAAFRVSPRIPDSLQWLSGAASEILFKANIRLATNITYITQALQSKYALPGDKSTLLPNGFDMGLFTEHPAGKMRRKMEIGSDDFVLGFVGTLGQEWVDFAPIFAAIRGLKHSIPGVKLLIVGNGKGLNRNKDMAAKYGIADRVLFTGYVAHEQVPSHISCMDVCVIPFTDEALTNHASPIKLFEYMACGRPIISKPSAGVVEVVGEGVLYAADEEEWTKRIVQLYKDPALRARMGTEGKEFVKRNYSWTRICQQFEAVLLEAMLHSEKPPGERR